VKSAEENAFSIDRSMGFPGLARLSWVGLSVQFRKWYRGGYSIFGKWVGIHILNSWTI
jgi:hypothetical protein